MRICGATSRLWMDDGPAPLGGLNRTPRALFGTSLDTSGLYSPMVQPVTVHQGSELLEVRVYHRTVVPWSSTCASGSDAPAILSSLHFFATFASGLVSFSMLGLWLIFRIFHGAPKVLFEMLIIESPRRLCPSHICTLLDYKTNTCKFISPT